MSSHNILKGPSAHLSWAELACKDGTPYPREFVKDGRVFKLAGLFESIRKECGDKPIRVTSAYRTVEHNKKIGGARNSQHLHGRALDLYPPKGFTVTQFYDLIRANADRFNIGGLGRYRTFVHVDIRPTNKLVAWSGTSVKDSRRNT